MTFDPVRPGLRIKNKPGVPRLNRLSPGDRLAFERVLSAEAKAKLVGNVIFKGKHPTIVGRRECRVYDGRAVRNQLQQLPNDAMVYPIPTFALTEHAKREIVKGNLVRNPALVSSPNAASNLEAAYQVVSDRTARWMKASPDKAAELVAAATAFVRPTSLMKNHDADVEAQCRAQHLEWLRRRTKRGPTPGQTDQAVRSALQHHWAVRALLSVVDTEAANDIKNRNPTHPVLIQAPIITVMNTVTGAPLTYDEIAKIKNA